MILMGFTASRGGYRSLHYTAGTTADWNTMIKYLRTTGKHILSLKKDKIRFERLSPHVGQCTSPHCHRYQGVPDPEGRGTGETVTLLTDLNLCDRFLFRKLKHLLREDEFGGHEEATLTVQRAMRRVSEDELYDQLRKLRGHCHDVIAVGRDFVY
ncbi:Uncharacterized protein FKW44_001720 [Caligus rogercresseyi]|uniref:Uncharacterized protein n=1 Tax=Caligus rogercresseyi TaxID=217165 RepID=A0A7T8KJ46_CALRO|nr:Uncharacterized protein FKW44_001720 [Caligus rogercresseyi]